MRFLHDAYSPITAIRVPYGNTFIKRYGILWVGNGVWYGYRAAPTVLIVGNTVWAWASIRARLRDVGLWRWLLGAWKLYIT